jgi:hypothetical protein
MRPLPTAPLAAGSLVASYGVVAATGSRPLGGAVLAAGGLCCIAIWRRRHGTRTAVRLGAVGFAAFVVSHVLALAMGPWPSVLVVAAATAAAAWVLADARMAAPAQGSHSGRRRVRFAPWHTPPLRRRSP